MPAEVNPEAAVRFASALAATSRAAFARFVALKGLDLSSPASKGHARKLFDAQAPLLDSSVAQVALGALRNARGLPVASLPISWWASLQATRSGVTVPVGWRDLAAWHAYCGGCIAPKGSGLVYNPSTTVGGVRANATTLALHALVLDCDGFGTWDRLWRVLSELGFAAISHQSGGWSPETPKWRVILPLSRPFATGTPALVEAWRGAYALCRVVFGALGRLTSVGFDPATDLACNAWFPGARRLLQAPPRQALFTEGASLDIEALLSCLPRPTTRHPGGRARTWTAFTPSLLELAFDEAGMLGRDLGQGRTAVLCPWNDVHTVPLAPDVEPSSASVLFPSNSPANVGAFHCAHSSCGPKATNEVLDALPADAVQRARLLHGRGESATRDQRLAGLPRLGDNLPRLWSDLP